MIVHLRSAITATAWNSNLQAENDAVAAQVMQTLGRTVKYWLGAVWAYNGGWVSGIRGPSTLLLCIYYGVECDIGIYTDLLRD